MPGLYLQKDGKTVFYGHDTGCNLSPEAWALIKKEKFDLVSLDATMGTKSVKEYHMGLPDAEHMFEKLSVLGCTNSQTVKVVNHFSHNGEMTYDQLALWGKNAASWQLMMEWKWNFNRNPP